MRPSWIADFAFVRIGSVSSCEELPVLSCGNTPTTRSHGCKVQSILFSVAPTGVKGLLIFGHAKPEHCSRPATVRV